MIQVFPLNHPLYFYQSVLWHPGAIQGWILSTAPGLCHGSDSHWLLTTDTCIHHQDSLCGIYGGKISTGTRFIFSLGTCVILCHYHSTVLHIQYFIYLPPALCSLCSWYCHIKCFYSSAPLSHKTVHIAANYCIVTEVGNSYMPWEIAVWVSITTWLIWSCSIKADKTVAENNKSVMIAVGFFCRSVLDNSEDCFRWLKQFNKIFFYVVTVEFFY